MPSDKEIKDLIKNNNIKTIYLQFVDINGNVKALQMQSHQIDEILQNKIMFDGSSISGYRDNETLDLRLFPDKSTFLIFPFKISKLKNAARLICDIHNADGTPFCGCPRSNLKRIIENTQKYGYKMQIGPEVEFFLFKTKNGEINLTSEEKTGYYDANQSHQYNDVLMQMIMTLSEMDFEISALHHEGAPFQHEIDLGYDEILKTADKLITFKFVTKTIADAFGFTASFMPKPIYGQNGSGLHLNISMTDNNGKKCKNMI